MQTRTGENPFSPHEMWLVDHLSVDADNTGVGIGFEGCDDLLRFGNRFR